MLTLLFLALNAYAVNHLPCQRLLQGSAYTLPDRERITLAADQVVVEGKLQAFWETGMEDQTGWSVLDRQIQSSLSADGYDALFMLEKGARVFILNPDGSVFAQGFHDEYFEPGVVNIGGREIPVSPNRPRLLTAPLNGSEVLDDDEYAALFERGARVLAVVRVPPSLLHDLDGNLRVRFEKLGRHLADPARFVAIGSGFNYELRIFEEVHRGKVVVDDAGVMQLSQSEKEKIEIDDRLYFLNAAGEQIGQIILDRFPAYVKNDEQRALIQRADRCVLIHRVF